MRIPRTIQLAAALAALGGGALLVWRSVGQGADVGTDAPGGTLWLCRRSQCGRDFVVTTKDLGVFYGTHPEGTPPCPACAGSDTVRAVRCSGCGKAFVPPPRSAAADAGKSRSCPHCGKAMG